MKTKHTKAKLYYTKNLGSVVVHDSDKNTLCDIWYDKTNEKEAEANAKLIAEAVTVANETGKTPRQLADERAELLEALILAKKWLDERGNNCHWQDKEKINNAIKKATE